MEEKWRLVEDEMLTLEGVLVVEVPVTLVEENPGLVVAQPPLHRGWEDVGLPAIQNPWGVSSRRPQEQPVVRAKTFFGHPDRFES